jgi:hypothetical protein
VTLAKRLPAVVLAGVVALAACRPDAPPPTTDASPRAAWPPLPHTDEEAATLFASRTRRPASPPTPPLDPGRVRASLEAAIAKGGAAAGWPAIHAGVHAWMRDGAGWLLVGAHHDRAAPVEAFRRLVGPESEIAWSRVALEQLRADGRWQGVPESEQRGETSDLARFSATGDRAAYARLLASQEKNDYAAWKYDYARAVLDVAASTPSVAACDATRSVAERMPEASRGLLRELHCLLALEDAPGARPQRIAVLWGDDHVQPDRFPRLLSPDATVVIVRIPREAPAIVVDPILFADAPDEAILLVPEPGHERAVDRVREHDAQAPKHRLRASSRSAVELRIGGRVLALGPEPRDEPLAPGAHAFVVYARAAARVAGALVVPEDGSLDLRVEDSEPVVTITVKTP